jgi:hypothetical protein
VGVGAGAEELRPAFLRLDLFDDMNAATLPTTLRAWPRFRGGPDASGFPPCWRGGSDGDAHRRRAWQCGQNTLVRPPSVTLDSAVPQRGQGWPRRP